MRILSLGLALLVFCAGMAQADTVRIAAQKTGTLAWELDVIRARQLDQKRGLTIETTELASPEAGKIVFYPYSSALGAVMVPASSPMRTLADLRGKKLAVAGGPIDKSWLLLQAA